MENCRERTLLKKLLISFQKTTKKSSKSASITNNNKEAKDFLPTSCFIFALALYFVADAVNECLAMATSSC
jgi:hypothetical protein